MESFGKTKGKHRQAFDRSIDLFHPDLNLKWKRSSGLAQLQMDGETIWKGHPYTTEKWLQRWQNLPVADVRERNFETLDAAFQHRHRSGFCNTTDLLHLLSICDRRVGWNTLSVMLFTEPDPVRRRLIARRVYGAPTDK